MRTTCVVQLCKNEALDGKDFCRVHSRYSKGFSCKAKTKKGKPCGNRGVNNTGWCLVHQPKTEETRCAFGGWCPVHYPAPAKKVDQGAGKQLPNVLTLELLVKCYGESFPASVLNVPMSRATAFSFLRAHTLVVEVKESDLPRWTASPRGKAFVEHLLTQKLPMQATIWVIK